MAFLYLTHNDGSEYEYELPDELVRIGRAPENEIRLDDDSASSFHAEIHPDGPRHVLKDLGSTNGVRVNGERIQESALADGDLLRFGNVRGRYERQAVDAAGAAQAQASATQPSAAPTSAPAHATHEDAPKRGQIVELDAGAFGPKKPARDPEKLAYIAVGWIVGFTAMAAIALSFMMS